MSSQTKCKVYPMRSTPPFRPENDSFRFFTMSNGQNRVHPDARWPKPGTPFHASRRAPSYWPTPAQTRLWPSFKRVHPILATHPPIGYPISATHPPIGYPISITPT